MEFQEAIKWLGKKYQIPIPTERTEAQAQEQAHMESLKIAMDFGQKYWSDLLHQDEEGYSIGMAYIKERGITAQMVQRFGLGYRLLLHGVRFRVLRCRGHVVSFRVVVNLCRP